MLDDIQNFRIIPLEHHGHRYCVAAFANPVRYPEINPKPYGPKLDKLYDSGYKGLICLDDPSQSAIPYEHVYRVKKYWSSLEGTEFLELLMEDFTAPSIEYLDCIIQTIGEWSKKDSPSSHFFPAIYCGAGFGRSGTAVSAIILYDLWEREFRNNAVESIEQYRKGLLSGLGYSEEIVTINGNVTEKTSVTKRIAQAINTVRSFDKYSDLPDEQSVEMLEEVESLLKFERYLVAKHCISYLINTNINFLVILLTDPDIKRFFVITVELLFGYLKEFPLSASHTVKLKNDIRKEDLNIFSFSQGNNSQLKNKLQTLMRSENGIEVFKRILAKIITTYEECETSMLILFSRAVREAMRNPVKSQDSIFSQLAPFYQRSVHQPSSADEQFDSVFKRLGLS